MLPKRKTFKGKTRSQPKLDTPVTKTPKNIQYVLPGKSKLNSTHSQGEPIDPPLSRLRCSMEDITHKLNLIRQSSQEPIKPTHKAIDNYRFDMEIGQGAFGKVWKAFHVPTMKVYAIKAMQKTKIIIKRSVMSVMNERMILSRLKPSPFIVNPVQAFQDDRNLYLVMEYMPGGDLRYLMFKQRRYFCEEQAKFLICCLLIAVSVLHKNNVIHRDIKPENLVIDDKGYLRITDMGISKIFSNKLEPDNSGTPAYMAPEALQSYAQNYSVDHYAIGVICYELVMGKRPYDSKSRQEIKQEIREKKQFDFAENLSMECRHFIKRLLQPSPEKRLGNKGFEEIYKHKWLDGIQWTQFKKKKYISPFAQQCHTKKFNTAHLQHYNNLLQEHSKEQRLESDFLEDRQVQEVFKGYNYRFV